MSGEVRSVGVFVRRVSSEDYEARLRRSSAEDAAEGLTDEVLSEDEIAAEVDEHSATLTLSLQPIAVLTDGREVFTDPAFGHWEIDVMGVLVSAPEGELPPAPTMTAAMIEDMVRSDFFEPSDTASDRWGWLVMTLQREGVSADAAVLERLPFDLRVAEGLPPE